MTLKPLEGSELNARDAERRATIRRLMDEGRVQTGRDYQYAALVFQHGQIPADWALAHILASTAAIKGQRTARWLSAATLDRWLIHTNQPQIFGTQFTGSKGTGVRWTMEPYNRDAISDAVRAQWCVVPLAEQLKVLKDANAGKPLTGTNLRDCP